MITKPDNYDKAQESTGEYKILPLDGYVCVIKKATEETSKAGNPMLVLMLDIDEGDYHNFYTDAYKNNTRENKKWGCVYRQMLTDSSAGFFKGLVTCIEKSNNFAWNFDEGTLANKKVGMLFQREEYRKKNGDVGVSIKPAQPRTAEKIRTGDFNMLEDKKIESNSNSGQTFTQDFEPLDDEHMPF